MARIKQAEECQKYDWSISLTRFGGKMQQEREREVEKKNGTHRIRKKIGDILEKAPTGTMNGLERILGKHKQKKGKLFMVE